MGFLRVSILLSIAITAGLAVEIITPTPNGEIFTATSPKLLRANNKYVIHVFRPASSTPGIHQAIKFSSSINGSATETTEPVDYQSNEVDIGQYGTLEIDVKELPINEYNLTVVAKVGEKEYREVAVIYKDTKFQSLLLQTDKVIYKPGEKVNFRVIMLCSKLRPLNDQRVEVTIVDPKGNIVKSHKDQVVNHGIFTGDFLLSTEPNLGDWKIKAKANGQREQITFSVDQYVLPKFSVDVKLPVFVTYNNSKFIAEVKAMYTYGKPMKGEVEVKLQEFARYHWGQPPKVVMKRSPIDGSAFFEFDIAKELGQLPLTYEKQFQVFASVTDAITGKVQNGTSTIRVHQHPYKIETIENPDRYKPGFDLTLKFKISSHDGVPVHDPDPKALKIEHGFSCNAEEGVVYFPIPENGIVNVTFVTPTNEFVYTNSLRVTYKDVVYNAYPPQKTTTPSKVYMDVSLDSYTPEVNGTVQVAVKMNQEFDVVYYILIARGKILETNSITTSNPESKEANFRVTVPASAAPEGTIIVYTVVPTTGEIVAESSKFTLPSVFENHMDVTLSKTVGEPGDPVTLSIDTVPDSLIALRGIDQSVLLLKPDRDITAKTIEDELRDQTHQIGRNKLWGGSPSYQVFEDTGVVILTNGKIGKPLDKHGYPVALEYQQVSYDSAPAAAFGAPAPIRFNSSTKKKTSVSSSSQSPEIRLRTKFPETWLWTEVNATGSITNLEKIIPDTLTSWYITGFSLSPSTGIGITKNPQILQTFRPFFITLNLPYSVVKGETFGLQVLVHNYIASEVTAEITLKNNANAFELLEEEDKSIPESTKKITLGPNEVKSLTFVVKPIVFGKVSVDVKGVTVDTNGAGAAGDALSKPLIVKPPGQQQIMNKAVLVDLRKESTVKQTLTTEFAPVRVEGADFVKVSVISDILGSSISNLDKLLKMPAGCGEQNMVYFVPDVVILQYLERIGKLTPIVRAKALKFLESGYQRELTYRHSDGSFSAFGKHDEHGSTWLTAFVIRSFVAAKPYITIDDHVIFDGLKFLASKQQSDGSFVEHGTVLNNELKGGAIESLSLSAYVTLAFVETAEGFKNSSNLVNITEVSKKALEYISNAPVQDLDNPYATSIVTYALHVAGHEKKNDFAGVLEKQAKRDGDTKYWEPKKREVPLVNTTTENNRVIIKRPWEPRIKPVSVEMTSYALLTYMLDGNLDKALPVAKWLLQQRNEAGGFISTQDTVVGLTALAKFASIISSEGSDLSIKVNYEGGSQVFKVNQDNEIVLQEAVLPPTTSSIEVEAEGKGTGLVQLTYSFYVEQDSETPAFELEVKTQSTGAKLSLDVCASYTHLKGKDSNMAVLEVNLPSGYTFDTDGLDTVNEVNKVKRFDVDDGDTKINVYFDSLNDSPSCITLPANRVYKVADPAKAYVTVYDYYDTTLRAREFYNPPEMSACEICIDELSCALKNCV